jgi:hypothetical protein
VALGGSSVSSTSRRSTHGSRPGTGWHRRPIVDAASLTFNWHSSGHLARATPGERIEQLLALNEGSLVLPALRQVPFTNPDGSDGVDLYLDQEAFPATFAGDVNPETVGVMAATQRPWSAAALSAPSGPPAWKSIPSFYLLRTEDRATLRRRSASWPSAQRRQSSRSRPPTPPWLRSHTPRRI